MKKEVKAIKDAPCARGSSPHTSNLGLRRVVNFTKSKLSIKGYEVLERFCLLLLLLHLALPPSAIGQCTNTFLWPTNTVVSNNSGFVQTIATDQYEGDYSIISNMISGNTYAIGLSLATAYITVRTGSSSGAVVAHGTQPLQFVAPDNNDIFVHYNTNAVCGTDNINRLSTIQNLTVIPPPATIPVVIVGDATWQGNECYRLTVDQIGQRGAIWSPAKIDIGANFHLEGSLNLGDLDISGADGMWFVWQAVGNNIDDYFGISPSIAVEFDTYQNGPINSDPLDDHIALLSNGILNHALPENLQGPVTVSDLENDVYHPFVIDWNATTHTLTVSLDGVQRINYTGDIVTNIFGGTDEVYWGFTGFTGDESNNQSICLSSVVATPAAQTVTLTCPTNTTTTACQTQAAVDAAFSAWLATANGTGGCGGVLTNNSVEQGNAPPACGGSRTVTFTYTSTCGTTTTTCQATFTVDTPPMVVLFCPTDKTTTACQTQSALNNAFALWLLTDTGTGGCDDVLTNNSVALGGAPSRCGGSRTVTFTYTSSCAPTTTTCQATFTVPTAPSVTLTCPADITTSPACRSQAEIDGVFSLWLASASGSGGCNGTLTNNSVSLGGAPSACGGSRTVTFIYSSTCGTTTTTCQATFTVPAAPTVSLTCPMNQNEAFGQTQAAINTKFATWLATASGSGGCNGVLTNNNTGAPPATGGTATVTFTYTSSCAPLTSTCQASFTVSNTPPVILNCPNNATASDDCLTQDQLTAEYNAWLATASGSGGCGGVLTNNSTGPPTICSATATVKTVEFTYTSTCEPLITTCQATFTVPAYPDFNGQPNSGALRVCLAQTEQPIPPVISDACGKPITPTGPTIVDSPASLTCEGTRTYTYTYTDCAGHSHDWSFVWTLDIPTLSVDNPGTATVPCPSFTPPTYPNTITDACGRPLTVTAPTVTSSPDPITCEGTKTYTWNLTDCAGNMNTWSWIITIERNDFTLPANGGSTVACPADADVVPTPPSKMSECGELIIPTGPVVSATPSCEGTKTYTWTYTDCEGNSHDWVYTYTIERNDFTVPANGAATVSCPSAITTPTPPTVTSNCGETLTPTGPVVVNTPEPLTCAGTRTYTWTYTDCEGNMLTWSFTYTVSPTLPVTITCPTNTTTTACQTQAQLNTAYVNWLNTLSGSGGCNGSLTSTAGTPSVCGSSTTLTFTHVNACGNQSCQATFTVPAPPPVVLTCPTTQLEAFGQTQPAINAKFAAWLATASASGGCNGVLSNNNTGAPPASGGTTTVTFTYTSNCAPLTTTCQATFTVSSVPPVMLTCPTIITTASSACLTQTQLTAEYNAWLATAIGSGGCNGLLTNNSPGAPSICSATAINQPVTFTYMSSCAPLTSTCSATFIVPAYPDFTLPADANSTVACLSDAVQGMPPTVMDGCNKPITPTGPVITSTFGSQGCEGSIDYTWVYTDCAGNTKDWRRGYIIERQPFTVPANGAATVACLALAVPPAALPTVTSNCGETLTPSTPMITDAPNPLSCEGTRAYAYTYTDCEGNTAVWSFVYTIEHQPFSVAANGAATVGCTALVTMPTPPAVNSNCGEPITPTGPVISPMLTNGGTQTYTWTYTDCEGNTQQWVFTYTINPLPAAPTAAAAQSFCILPVPTVGSLAVSGTNILWYANANGGTPLATSLPLVSGNTYYASQATVVGCESATRTSVLVTLNADCFFDNQGTAGSTGVPAGFTPIDPCSCNNNSNPVTQNNGTFNEFIQVVGPSGATIIGTATNGTPSTLSFVEVSVGGGQSRYTSNIFTHVDNIGYSASLFAQVGAGPAFSIGTIGNKCVYPNVAVDPKGPFFNCLGQSDVPLTAVVGNAPTGGVFTWSGTGVNTGNFNPSGLPVGTVTTTLSFDGAFVSNVSPDNGITAAFPGCIQTASGTISVTECCPINFGVTISKSSGPVQYDQCANPYEVISEVTIRMENTSGKLLGNVYLDEIINTLPSGAFLGLAAYPDGILTNATVAPQFNYNWNGTTNTSLFTNNSGVLDLGQYIEVSLPLKFNATLLNGVSCIPNTTSGGGSWANFGSQCEASSVNTACVGGAFPSLVTPPTTLTVNACLSYNNEIQAWLAAHGGATFNHQGRIVEMICNDYCAPHNWQYLNNCSQDATLPVVFTVKYTDGSTFEYCSSINRQDPQTVNILQMPTDLNLECTSANIPAQIQIWLNNDGGLIGQLCNGYLFVENNYVAPAPNCLGSRLVTFTVSNECGLSTSATASINIIENLPLKFTYVPASAIVDCNEGVSFGQPIAESIYGGVIIAYEDISNLTVCGSGTVSRHWIATDAMGNTAQSAQTITILADTELPSITLANNSLVVDCASAIPVEMPLVSDNCASSNEIILVYQDVHVENTVLRTWTAEDVCGNYANATQVYIILDTQVPQFTTALQNKTINCGAPILFDQAAATDACSAVSLTYTDAQIAINCGVECIRTWTASDSSGNASTKVQQITVVDSEAPVFTFIPANQVVASASEVVFGTPQAADVCSSVQLTYSDVQSGQNACGGYTITRTWTALDACENAATIAQTIAVGNDTQAPIFSVTPVNQSVAYGQAVIFEVLTATDNNGAATITYSDVQSGLNACGGYTITRTWTALDACENAATIAQTIAVGNDTQAPIFSVTPVNQSVAYGQAVIFEVLTATDNNGAATITYSDVQSGLNACGGYTITRTWTALDACENAATIAQTIAVGNDTQAPIFSVTPVNQSVAFGQAVIFEVLTATDNNGAATITYSDVQSEQNICGGYTITRTWTALDACENAATIAQTIAVGNDTQAPIFSVTPVNQSVAFGQPLVFEVLTATDNNGAATITYSDIQSESNICGGYTITRTWTALDACENAATIAQTIAVGNDTQAPIFSVTPVNQSVAYGQAVIFEVLTATDNNGAATITYTDVESEPNACTGYTVTRTWTAQDVCENETSIAQTITVRGDIETPVFTDVLVDKTIDCSGLLVFDIPTATDNSSEVTLNFTDVQSTPSCGNSGYTMTRVYAVTDACNNAAQIAQTITITEDTEAPVFIGSVNDIEMTYATFNAWVPVPMAAADNCQAVEVLVGTPVQIDECNYTVDYTATDACGNFVIRTQNIKIVDCLVLGTNEGVLSSVSIYPNPVETELSIVLSSEVDLKNVTAQVFDMLGKQVVMTQVVQHQSNINVSMLAAGSYTLRLTAEGGVKSVKFVKQ